MAFNYGGKAEIAEAVRRIAAQVAAGRLRPEDITEETISRALYTPPAGPDLVIRTSGEQRSPTSCSAERYAELAFVDAYWPDFDERHFLDVLGFFGRDRRYGGVEAQRR